MVKTAQEQVKRVKSATVSDAVIRCVAESQSGHSEWEFSVDFNDWGHITGKRWTWSENTESNIPDIFGRILSEHIHAVYKNKGIHIKSRADIVDKYATLRTEADFLRQKCTLFENILYKKKTVELQYQPYELAGEHLYVVISILKRNGFVNIKAIPQKDVDKKSEYTMFEVEGISIGGRCDLKKGEWFKKNAEVAVIYHIKKEIEMPYSSRYFKGKNYIDVINELDQLGYANIGVRPIRDLVTGWLVKDGAVDKVVLAGIEEEPIKKNTIYEYDTRMIVCYHTL